MKFSEPKDYKVNDLSIHPAANATPLMTKEQYNALKLDIDTNGQIDPIILYRGRIVDGRHRYMIAKDLNKESIVAISMSNNSTVDDIKSLVKSKETHRHQTPTQLAIYAYRFMKEHNADVNRKEPELTQAETAEKLGVVVKQIGRVARIDNKLMRPDILDMLFDGGKFNIGTPNRPLLTDSLQSIINYLDKIKAEQSDIKINLEVKREMTEEDYIMSNRLMALIRDQNSLVKEHLSKRLYAEINDLPDCDM